MNTLCKNCGKLYDTEEELKNHFQEVHQKVKKACHLCNALVYNLKLHVFKHHENVPQKPKSETPRSPCEFCGKIVLLRNMNKHVRMCTSTAPRPTYKCEICGKDFLHEHSMKSHKLTIHDGIRENHPCPTCGKSYYQESDLNRHIKSFHEDRRDHVCGTCNKAFFTNQQLKNHRQSQTHLIQLLQQQLTCLELYLQL